MPGKLTEFDTEGCIMINVAEYQRKTQETGDEYPLLTLEEFFVGNDDEYSIAPNQADEGRPSLDEIYAKFKSLESKDNIAWIRVILHDDTEIIESDDGEELALYGDSICVCTCISQEEVEALIDCDWLQSGGAMEIDIAEYINDYPEIPEGYHC